MERFGLSPLTAIFKMIASIENLYGDRQSAKKALNLMKTVDFKSELLRRHDPLMHEET